MPKVKKRSNMAGIAFAVALLSPGAASAQIFLQLWNIESVTAEREWSYKRKPPVKQLIFGWSPELDPDHTIYYLRAVCNISGKKEKNKVFFEDVLLLGVQSDNSVGAVKQSKLIKKGKGKVALWDLTPHVFNFQEDSTVLVTGSVRLTKNLKAFKNLTCEFAVVELFDINDLIRAPEAERLEFFRDVVENPDLSPYGDRLSERLKQRG
ncbi:MAG: hypothetical protein IH936_10490 [Acidobacteria bacterium]|nr:hypothetical protein [Acidobacteriota bacterium]